MIDPRPFHIGAIEVLPIFDGRTAIPEPEAISGKSHSELAAHRRYIPGDGRYLTDFGAFVLRAGDQVVLLDAGLGPSPNPTGVWDPSQAPPDAVAEVVVPAVAAVKKAPKPGVAAKAAVVVTRRSQSRG